MHPDTHPRHWEGAGTRWNALQHGRYAESALLPGEDPAQFQRQRRTLFHNYRPQTKDEADLVETMAEHRWSGRRYGFAEPDPVVADLRAILSENVEKTMAVQEQRKAKVQEIYNEMHTDDGALQMANGILSRLAIYERGGRV